MITIELFGAPRLRAGQASWTFEAETLGEALSKLVDKASGLASILLNDGSLHPAYRICLNERQFLIDLSTKLSQGDVLLLMAADVGG